MRPHRIFVATICVVTLETIAFAAEPPRAPAAKLEAIKKEASDAQAAYTKGTQALPPTPEGNKKAIELFREFDKRQSDAFAAAVALAAADPKSETGFAALEWLLTIPRVYVLRIGKTTLELTAKHHAANPKVGKLVAEVGHFICDGCQTVPASIALFQAVVEQNQDRTARGQAALALAWQAGRTFAAAEYERTADVDELRAGAEKAFDAVSKDYADCPRLIREGLPTLGEEANRELYALRNLRVGKVAPEIEGEDLKGTKFKLSDYRGKVTVVLFWATWCGPCMAMVPQERRLVARTKKRPFALIGVNGDHDAGKAKQAEVKEQMTWSSFWNGPGGPEGPLTRAWNVRYWPAVRVLDSKGVIRFRHRLLLQSNELDQAVDFLLKELEG